MNYEEKYKQSLELARDYYKANLMLNNADENLILEDIFPELAKSNDERIRKEIVDFINRVYERQALIITDEEKDNWIAWLEKQGKETKWKLYIEDDVRRRSTIQILEYARSLDSYNQYGKKDIDKNIAWLENQGKKESEDEIIPDKNEVRGIEQNLAGNDEKIRKAISQCVEDMRGQFEKLYSVHHKDAITWLEKQGTSYTKKDVDDAYLKGVNDAKNEVEKQYKADYQIRKDIATFIFNYRGDLKDRGKWMNYLGIKVYFFEKEDEKPRGKSATEAIKEEKVFECKAD